MSRQFAEPRGPRLIVVRLLLLLCVAVAADVSGSSFPLRPIRLVIPFPPGGGTDLVGRFFAERLTNSLGQQVIVDNRGGAGGNIGNDVVAKAQPNGYTLLLASGGMTISQSLYRHLPFNVLTDFAPVSMLVSQGKVLVVHPTVPVRSVSEFVSFAKSKSGSLRYGTPGIGTPQHMAMELFNAMANLEMVHIPYRGTGPSLVGLLANEFQVMFATLAVIGPHVKQGSVRALAVTSTVRSRAFPELPTIDESGFPGYELPDWYAILAPAHTPDAIVSSLNKTLRNILAQPETIAKLEEIGFDPAPSVPEELMNNIRRETRKWEKIIRARGLTAE